MQAITKVVMIVAGLVVILLWGVAPLLSSPDMAKWFQVDHAGKFAHWARFFGMMGIVWGLMILVASIKPAEHKMIVNFTILLFLFSIALLLLQMYVIKDVDGNPDVNPNEWIWWVSVGLSAVFVLALLIFYPRKEKAVEAGAPAPAPEPTPAPPAEE